MTERRSQLRRKAFLGGRAVFAGGNQSFECLVLNFTDGGAELHSSGVNLLPQMFDLLVPHKARSFSARICWRREDWVGVEFLDSHPLQA